MQLNPIPHQEGRDPPSITYQEVWFPISLCHHLIVGKTTYPHLAFSQKKPTNTF